MLGSQEMILIFIVVILLFGATKLPELARSMGKSVGEFKRAQRESELEMQKLNVPTKDVENINKQAK
jgi:sec-independent protein translocase protein TatA